jgi:hypothetical protein
LFVQDRYLPPRLTADASQRLNSAYEQAEAERQRLRGELGQTSKKLEVALADKKGLVDELATSHAAVARLQADLASAVDALPPDPRGGAVALRAGRFAASAGMLSYEIVLTRERAAGKPLVGVLQLAVVGASARGNESTVSLKPIAVSLGRHEVLRGSLPLPEGLRPLRASVQVLDRSANQVLGTRIWMVK